MEAILIVSGGADLPGGDGALGIVLLSLCMSLLRQAARTIFVPVAWSGECLGPGILREAERDNAVVGRLDVAGGTP